MSVEVTEVSWSFGNDVLHIDAEWRASEQDELFSGESMWDEGIFWITQEEEMTLDFAFDNASEKDVTDMYQKHLEKKADAYKSGDISARMPVCLRKESK